MFLPIHSYVLRGSLSQRECCKTRNPLSVKLRNELQASDIPLLASPQGGVAASSKKILRSHRSRRGRGGFPFCSPSENHPVRAISGCYATFSYSRGHPSLR